MMNFLLGVAEWHLRRLEERGAELRRRGKARERAAGEALRLIADARRELEHDRDVEIATAIAEGYRVGVDAALHEVQVVANLNLTMNGIGVEQFSSVSACDEWVRRLVHELVDRVRESDVLRDCDEVRDR